MRKPSKKAENLNLSKNSWKIYFSHWEFFFNKILKSKLGKCKKCCSITRKISNNVLIYNLKSEVKRSYLKIGNENVENFMRFICIWKTMVNASDIKMNVCRYRNIEHVSSYGLLYRHANKSRRKVPSVILIILPLMFSMPLSVCAGDDRIVRVDPLGTILDFNPFYQNDTFSYQFPPSHAFSHFVCIKHVSSLRTQN